MRELSVVVVLAKLLSSVAASGIFIWGAIAEKVWGTEVSIGV